MLGKFIMIRAVSFFSGYMVMALAVMAKEYKIVLSKNEQILHENHGSWKTLNKNSMDALVDTR